MLLSFGANPNQINEKSKQTPKSLARNSECLKLLNEDLSKYKPFKKSKYAITLIALDGSENMDYNNSINHGPGQDVTSSETSHTITTYQRGGGTWTNISSGIKLPESMNSVSIDGGNHFSSSRDERKFRALLHQIDEIDKKEKKRKYNSEHHEKSKIKKKLKTLAATSDVKERIEKPTDNNEEKSNEDIHKNSSSKDLKYNSEKEESIKSIKKKKEKIKHESSSSNLKKEIDKSELIEQKIKDKEKLKHSQEKHKTIKTKYKSNEISNSYPEEKVKKSLSTKEKLKEIINASDKSSAKESKSNENDYDTINKNNNNNNSKNYHLIENNGELDEEETIDVVETATPTYAEEPIIDNDDLLLSSDLGLMYTRQRSTRKNINYDLTSETSTPQLSPTAQHSIGDYDMSWAEDMSFLKTIKEDKTDGDWIDTSKKSGSTGSRRKRRSTKSNDTDEKEKAKSNGNYRISKILIIR